MRETRRIIDKTPSAEPQHLVTGCQQRGCISAFPHVRVLAMAVQYLRDSGRHCNDTMWPPASPAWCRLSDWWLGRWCVVERSVAGRECGPVADWDATGAGLASWGVHATPSMNLFWHMLCHLGRKLRAGMAVDWQRGLVGKVKSMAV